MIHATAAESVMRSASVHEFQKGDGRAEGGSILCLGGGDRKAVPGGETLDVAGPPSRSRAAESSQRSRALT